MKILAEGTITRPVLIVADKFSRAAVDAHFAAYLAEMRRQLGPDGGAVAFDDQGAITCVGCECAAQSAGMMSSSTWFQIFPDLLTSPSGTQARSTSKRDARPPCSSRSTMSAVPPASSTDKVVMVEPVGRPTVTIDRLAGSEQKPDVLLLDVQMPKLTGFEVVELVGRDGDGEAFRGEVRFQPGVGADAIGTVPAPGGKGEAARIGREARLDELVRLDLRARDASAEGELPLLVG